MHVDIRVLGVQKYKLLDDVEYSDDKWIVQVSKGFVYDGASIPESLWSIIGCPIDYAYAACIHDALYRSRLLDKKSCDKIFHGALLKSGIDKATAKAMYLAVRVGGQSAYDDAIHMLAHYRNYVLVLPR